MPLNPFLYNQLLAHFGQVTIADGGYALQGKYVRNPGTGAIQLDVLSPGEYYCVNCPFCSDTKKRLWINHRWGVEDATGRRNHWLAICYNENCLAETANFRSLRDQVETLRQHPVVREQDILPGAMLDRPGELCEVTLPGYCVPLESLAEDHPARIYVERRQYDPVWLSRMFGVSFCMEHRLGWINRRLIIPIWFQGKLVGWQARAIQEIRDDTTPKYFTMPGLHKNQLFYNWDMASREPCVVLTEGATKAWRVGRCGLATLGKTKELSLPRLHLLGSLPQQTIIVVLMDGNAFLEGQELARQLHVLFPNRVVHVPLRGEIDPGDLSEELLWDWIEKAACGQGLD